MPPLNLDSMRRQIDADPAEAVRRLEARVERAPTMILARILLAEAYEAIGRTDDALFCWREAHFLMPGSPLPEIALARLSSENNTSLPVEEAHERTPLPPEATAPVDLETHSDAPTGVATTPIPEEDDPRPDDLDRLIEELEAAHIEPSIDAEEDIAEPNLDSDIDDMVSETLARIHEAQDQHAEAARIYLRLSIQEPERAEEFRHKAAEMRARASGP